MNNLQEIIEAIIIALNVATFLLNTGRALKAIELCKESLVFLNNQVPSVKQKIGKLIYRGMYNVMFMAYSRIHDNKNAITYGKKLLGMYRESGETVKEGLISMDLAQIHQKQSNLPEAKEFYERAITIMRETGDKENEANSCNNLGNVYTCTGDYVKAKEYLERALAINVGIGHREGVARNYGNLGTVFQSLSDYVKAKEYYGKALATHKEISDRAGEAANYGNVGIAFRCLGDYIKAKEYHEKALAITIDIGDRAGAAANYGNLGNVLISLGEYAKAKENLEKALAIQIEIGDKAGEASSNGNLANVFILLGDDVKAKEFLEKALEIKIEIGDRAGEASFYANLGNVALHLGQFRESNEYYKKALAIIVKTGDRKGEALVYQGLGSVLNSLGDHISAKQYFEKALAINLKIGYRPGEVDTYVKLGNVFFSLGEYVIAEEYLEKALSISKDTRDAETEYNCYCSLSLTKLSQLKTREAFFYLFQSIQKSENLRGFNADNDQMKISIADQHDFPYELLSAMFCKIEDHNNALYVTELGRARSLADLMANQYSAENHLSANPQTWIGIENVMAKESNCTCLYISYHFQQVFLWILKTNGVISFREVEVDEQTLNKTSAKPAEDLDEFFTIMVKSFRSFGILPEGACEDRSLLDDIEPAQSDSSQRESLVSLRSGNDEEDAEQSLTLLHDMLINHVSDLLEEPEIIIVPDRNLYRVPFAALVDENGKYLSDTFRIRIVPSLTTLKLIQDSPADYHSQTGALIVGDPEVGEVIYKGHLKNFVPLPGAREEAEMIGRLLGVQPLLGQHATKQAVLQRIASASLIHFAAHGNAERGEIAFAPPSSATETPQEDDFLLKMSEISQVQLQAKLVVLSCCHSGRGEIRAEGVVGIARAFLGSGARSVLVALWALDDTATESLMHCFYKHLVRGESASGSLHKAMKWMRDSGFTKVSEWAPFMLIGDNVTFDIAKLKEEKTSPVEDSGKTNEAPSQGT